MASTLVLAALALVGFVFWRLVHNFFVASPFDNIPGPAPGSIWAGHMLQLFDHNNWDFVRDMVETYGPAAKFQSFLGKKLLQIADPKAMHSILVKDQDSYSRGEPSEVLGQLLLGPGLFSTFDVQHKRQRKMLTPVFNAAYLRGITPTFYSIAGKLRNAISAQVQNTTTEVDMVAWMGRAALEIVGQGGLGHSFDPLVEETKNEYTEAVKQFVPAFGDIAHVRIFLPIVKYLGPSEFRRKLLDYVPDRKVQRMKVLTYAVYEKSKAIFEAKKAAIDGGDQELMHNIGEGKDVMSILLRENLMASQADKLTDEELLAQMATFIVAGVDTTSNAMAHVLQLLAEHPGAQTQLRNEVHAAQETYGDEIPFDEVMALPYLDAICRETLRLWAPVGFVGRTAVADTVLPLSEPLRGRDGTMVSEIAVPKGSPMFLNLRAWRPARWLAPLPKTVEDARIPGIYSHLTTFLSGGHSCVGFKFSQLEMKVILATLVSAFKFERSSKPIVWNFAPVSYPSTSYDRSQPEMFLNVTRLSDGR
ncbi:cytochrome P450 [Epithele typhae]|uniref:cytochrome P450 n=1 Tax=Epithele typhae TaxID=378194 RepID=UPI0020077447|nr:cytochrome P450 [Epithele typhae]KAH9940534.1 cytochrome P450 [Epithele typhae]